MKKKMKDENAITLDSEIIPYFVKLSLKEGTDYQILIKNALKYIIEQNLEPKNVWQKRKSQKT